MGEPASRLRLLPFRREALPLSEHQPYPVHFCCNPRQKVVRLQPLPLSSTHTCTLMLAAFRPAPTACLLGPASPSLPVRHPPSAASSLSNEVVPVYSVCVSVGSSDAESRELLLQTVAIVPPSLLTNTHKVLNSLGGDDKWTRQSGAHPRLDALLAARRGFFMSASSRSAASCRNDGTCSRRNASSSSSTKSDGT